MAPGWAHGREASGAGRGLADGPLSPRQFLVSTSKENSSAAEVLDSVAHSVRVKPENLRLAEVSTAAVGSATGLHHAPLRLAALMPSSVQSPFPAELGAAPLHAGRCPVALRSHARWPSPVAAPCWRAPQPCLGRRVVLSGEGRPVCQQVGQAACTQGLTPLLPRQVIKSRFHRMFLPSHSLDTVSPTDLLLCFEVLSPELAKERVVVLQVQQVRRLEGDWSLQPQAGPSLGPDSCGQCQLGGQGQCPAALLKGSLAQQMGLAGTLP